jgi:uncharacterized protein YdaU (DUF1376 family)
VNYYERHLGDYAKDTGHLTLLEHGVYTLLLDRYYATEAGIPSDQTYRIARARSEEECAAVDCVLSEFFHLDGNLWVNGRVEEELAKANVRIEAARMNGKKGGRPPKTAKNNPTETQEKPTGLLLGSISETQQKAHQTPDTSIHTPEDQKKEKARASLARPAGVQEQTWRDWLTLRKSKRAPVTETVLNGAIREAEKAGLTIERFLEIWCERGSQGLQADWLKPHERAGPVNGAKPSAAASFRGKTYTGTPIDDIPESLRPT